MIPKGCGSENNSLLKMAIPADGVDAIKTFVIDCVLEAGGKTCPPTIVGVGSAAPPTCACSWPSAPRRALGTPLRRSRRRGARGAALGGGEPARRRAAGPGRRLDRVRGARRTRGHAHHDEPGRGEHAVPLGAPRPRDLHAGRRELRLLAEQESRHGPSRMLTMPVTEAQVRALRVNDTVTLQRTLFGIRDATQIHMFDRGRKTRFDLRGHAVIHTAPNVRKVGASAELPGRLRADLHRHHHLRPHGALHAPADGRSTACASSSARAACAKARRRPSATSAAPISPSSAARRRWRPPGSSRSRTWTSTTSIPNRCGSSASRDFGPLLVAMDSHGGSLYTVVQAGRAVAPRTGAGRLWESRPMTSTCKRLQTDILILGSGGAGLFAALHAHQAAPELSITVAVKGLLGKCGCTRMVQGGYNVALAPGDSVERHFMDTIEGGKWLPDQDLAWTLVSDGGRAHPRARERARLLLRPQPRRHACTRRRSPGRPSTARCTRAT